MRDVHPAFPKSDVDLTEAEIENSWVSLDSTGALAYMPKEERNPPSYLFCLVETESGGWEVVGVDEVGAGEGLPSVTDAGGISDLVALDDEGVVCCRCCLCWVEDAIAAGNFEGGDAVAAVGNRTALTGVETVAVVEVDEDATICEFCRAGHGAGGGDVGLAIVVVEGETGEALSYFSFVAGMNIEGVAEIAGDGHIDMG